MKTLGLVILLVVLNSCAGAAMFDDGTDALVFDMFLNPTGSVVKPIFSKRRARAHTIYGVVKPLDTIINK